MKSDFPSFKSSVAEWVIEPRSGWQPVNFRELYDYRDLLRCMIWREILSRYTQSVLGYGWILCQPLVSMIIYTVVFSRVIGVPVPFDLPYPLFVLCGIVPWTFFSGAMSNASTSLIAQVPILSKVYFPRLILPLSGVLAKFLDLAINLGILGLLITAYGVIPRPEALIMVPLMTVVTAFLALGVGFWLSALAVQYRDVAYGLTYVIQAWMYLSPVFYSSTMIFDRVGPTGALIWGLNPMVGVISTFRSTLLGIHPIDWTTILEGVSVTAALFIGGLLYFRRSERFFADIA